MIDVYAIPVGCFCVYQPAHARDDDRKLVCLRQTPLFDIQRGLVSAFDVETVRGFKSTPIGFGAAPFYRDSDHARLYPIRDLYLAEAQDVEAEGIGFWSIDAEPEPPPLPDGAD